VGGEPDIYTWGGVEGLIGRVGAVAVCNNALAVLREVGRTIFRYKAVKILQESTQLPGYIVYICLVFYA
jgi:hypothetical protein